MSFLQIIISCKNRKKGIITSWSCYQMIDDQLMIESPKVFYKKCVLKNLSEFIGKLLRRSFFFNKVSSFQPATLLTKWLRYRCFSVNFTKFLRTLFLYKTSLVATSYFCKILNIILIKIRLCDGSYKLPVVSCIKKVSSELFWWKATNCKLSDYKFIKNGL